MTHGALFDPGPFFFTVADSAGWSRPLLFVVVSYAWGLVLFTLPVTLPYALYLGLVFALVLHVLCLVRSFGGG